MQARNAKQISSRLGLVMLVAILPLANIAQPFTIEDTENTQRVLSLLLA